MYQLVLVSMQEEFNDSGMPADVIPGIYHAALNGIAEIKGAWTTRLDEDAFKCFVELTGPVIAGTKFYGLISMATLSDICSEKSGMFSTDNINTFISAIAITDSILPSLVFRIKQL